VGAAIAGVYDPDAPIVLFGGDCREFLATLPAGAARLIVTSPPYNLGKAYERGVGTGPLHELIERCLDECLGRGKPSGGEGAGGT